MQVLLALIMQLIYSSKLLINTPLLYHVQNQRFLDMIYKRFSKKFFLEGLQAKLTLGKSEKHIKTRETFSLIILRITMGGIIVAINGHSYRIRRKDVNK